MTTRSPPQDPEFTSEPKILSPVSPKPLHFPIPSNIPVLENQIDLAFNQTATHMAATATTELPNTGAPSSQVTSNADAVYDPSLLAGEHSGENGTGYRNGHIDKGAQAEILSKDADSQMTNEPTVLGGPNATINVTNGDQENVQASHDPNTLPSPNAHDIALPSEVASQTPLVAPNTATSSQPIDALLGNNPTEGTDGGIDYEALLDSLSSTAPAAPQIDGVPTSATASTDAKAQPLAPGTAQSPVVGLVGAPASLPPRPPPQAQPAIHHNYTQSSDIRNYHPHAQNPAVQPHSQQSNYRPNGVLSHALPAAPYQTAAPGANGLPPPPLASFQQQTHSLPAMPGQIPSPATQAIQQREILESQREIKQAAGEILDDEDTPWTMERQRLYDQFLHEERGYVTEGKWEQFPNGSRLFVGK